MSFFNSLFILILIAILKKHLPFSHEETLDILCEPQSQASSPASACVPSLKSVNTPGQSFAVPLGTFAGNDGETKHY